jgi:transketolase N-terminal domain/subunit
MDLKKIARQIRRDIINETCAAHSGHPGDRFRESKF